MIMKLSDALLAQLAEGQAGGTIAMLAAEIIANREAMEKANKAMLSITEPVKDLVFDGDSDDCPINCEVTIGQIRSLRKARYALYALSPQSTETRSCDGTDVK